jgi:hypothetical protein
VCTVVVFLLFYSSPCSSATLPISSASPLPRVPLAASIIKGPNVAPASFDTLATGMSLVWFVSHHLTNRKIVIVVLLLTP